MKKISVLAFFALIILSSSCVSYITPNMSGDSNIAYLPRPLKADSVKSKIYLSGEYASSSPKGNLLMNSGLINLSRGHTFKKLNFAYGLFGFFGNASYQDSSIDRYSSQTIENFKRSFYGFGLRSAIGLQLVKNDFNFRYVNWENAFSSEFGEYAQYRKLLYDGPQSNGSETVYVNKRTSFYTTGLSTEAIWSNAFNDKNSQIGLRFFAGITPGLRNHFKEVNNQTIKNDQNNIAIILSSFIKFHQAFLNLQIGSEINTSIKIGLGYAF
ncbi:hypothetical protein I5M32_02960 [Pedobacter sp. SD-b]|uniref:Outer membrane protein beta-barrel domain-containing protein n=1 Tax=Pedobacter segetis TaxID=2793069 RepID=A0ABS1BGA6_9SPHI|nr:hypothetical protein [Pedobacter segetis]MBK0381907.1 hypothetical protein [Pedobacter segetis]